MHPYIHLFNLNISSYGLMALMSLTILSLFGINEIKKNNEDVDSFVILECIALIGALLGSKLLYIIINYDSIKQAINAGLLNFKDVMESGFVFYGGLLGALLLTFIFNLFLIKIDLIKYLNIIAPIVPFCHGVARIGCLLSGCCYGINYKGLGSVIYPIDSIAPSGVSLFPVQLLESFLLLLLSIFLFVLKRKNKDSLFIIYLLLYGIVRFFLEFLRGDRVDKFYLSFLSDSQIISIIIVLVSIFILIRKGKYGRKHS